MTSCSERSVTVGKLSRMTTSSTWPIAARYFALVLSKCIRKTHTGLARPPLWLHRSVSMMENLFRIVIAAIVGLLLLMLLPGLTGEAIRVVGTILDAMADGVTGSFTQASQRLGSCR